MKRRDTLTFVISIVLIIPLLTGCISRPSFDPSKKEILFQHDKAYLKPQTGSVYLSSDSARILKEAGVNFCSEDDVLWANLPQYKKGIFDYWMKTVQDANDAAKTYGTLDAKKAAWQKFGDTLNSMHENGQAGCSHPMSDKEYNYYISNQNKNQYRQQQVNDDSQKVQTFNNGVNQLTNQLNNMTNQMQMQNQQMQLQNQMYWQNQETNQQLHQLNNTLNGIRYGY